MPHPEDLSFSPPTVGALVAALRHLQAERAAGRAGRFTRDPRWLVNEAINRRAGWTQDPHFRGSTPPVPGGHLPRAAQGDAQRHLRQLADALNTPRRIVRESELGEWRGLLMARIPNRITTKEDL